MTNILLCIFSFEKNFKIQKLWKLSAHLVPAFPFPSLDNIVSSKVEMDGRGVDLFIFVSKVLSIFRLILRE
jgi:hypothetical protein